MSNERMIDYNGVYAAPEMNGLRYHCPNGDCHFEWRRFSTEAQTANVKCPNCETPLVMEEL